MAVYLIAFELRHPESKGKEAELVGAHRND